MFGVVRIQRIYNYLKPINLAVFVRILLLLYELFMYDIIRKS